MKNFNYEIIIPEIEEQIEQNEEWVLVDFGNKKKKVILHDYGAIYKIPGLYEEIFYKHLKCNSPKVVCNILGDLLDKSGDNIRDLKVLDFGAGNGIVGEQVKKMGCDLVVGIDILPEAKNAVNRDRPGVYDNYYVMDMSKMDDEKVKELRKYKFNCLITVSALGFNDIPTHAFLNAFNLIEDDGWIVFNIKDRFLTNKDDTGYKDIINKIISDGFSLFQTRYYCHRFSLSGEKLNYMVLVGKKVKNVNTGNILFRKEK